MLFVAKWQGWSPVRRWGNPQRERDFHPSIRSRLKSLWCGSPESHIICLTSIWTIAGIVSWIQSWVIACSLNCLLLNLDCTISRSIWWKTQSEAGNVCTQRPEHPARVRPEAKYEPGNLAHVTELLRGTAPRKNCLRGGGNNLNLMKEHTQFQHERPANGPA